MAARSLLPLDPSAVQPIRLGSSRNGVLLLHGFASTPPEMRRPAEFLADHGCTVYAPLLPGHGTAPEELEQTTWQDWAAGAQDALDELLRLCDTVSVVGQSMGGNLALHLAATNDAVSSAVLLATPIRLGDARLFFLPLLKHLIRWHVPSSEIDLFLPERADELFSYGLRPTRSIDQLCKLLRVVEFELPSIRQPVLIIQGERDTVINPRDADELERRLVSSASVERHMYPRSGHGITVDVDSSDVNRRLADWLTTTIVAKV